MAIYMGYDMKSFINKIIAAANVYRVTKDGVTADLVLVDNGHMCRNMQTILHFLKDIGCEVKARNDLEDRGQGFIDESGHYYNRSEAYVIAKASGQPFNDNYTLPDNKLDSSCIRHFPVGTKLSDYMSVVSEPVVNQKWIRIISDGVPYILDQSKIVSVGEIRHIVETPGWWSRVFFLETYEDYYKFSFRIGDITETVISDTFEEAQATRDKMLGVPLS